MEYYSTHINKLIEQLSHLPGIGPKSAQRLAFHIMNMPKDQVEQLTSSITGAREKIRYCKKCCTLTDQELCPICSNPKRDACCYGCCYNYGYGGYRSGFTDNHTR